jgi:hypothetical protein
MRDYLPVDSPTGSIGTAAQGAGYPSRANAFGIFDSEIMLALTHAVEDLALEDASGRLLCTFQDFAKFHTHRERYAQIATTLDEVLVLGVGRKPRPCAQVQFLNSDGTVLGEFWMVMYQGSRINALAIGRQINQVDRISDKLFRAFFTFDSRIIGRIRREVLDAIAGRQPAMPFFARLSALDQAEHQIRTRLGGELAGLEASVERMRHHPQMSPRVFIAELNQALDRLARLRDLVTPLFNPELKAKKGQQGQPFPLKPPTKGQP